jgi:hypothetical protein
MEDLLEVLDFIDTKLDNFKAAYFKLKQKELIRAAEEKI